jgi:hypothetical protein
MTPEGFWDATIKEVFLMTKAFFKKELNELKRVRLLRYDIYCACAKATERVGIYEYMPLEDDPTEEEVRVESEDFSRKEAARLTEAYEYYKQYVEI